MSRFKKASEVWKEDYKKENAIAYVPTYLPDLDTYIYGYPRGECSVIAAGSGVGKTVFATNAHVKIAQNKHKSLFLSMEMPRRKILEKAYAIVSGQKEWEVRLENNLTSDEYYEKKLNDGIKQLEEMLGDYYLIDDTKYSIDELCQLIKDADAEGIEVIFADNYQIITSGMDHTQIVAASEKIRETVRGTKVAFVHLSQITMDKDRKPQNAQIRNGQKLKDDAANLTILYRKKDNEEVLPQLYAYVDKNRYGKAFEEVELVFDAERQTIGHYTFKPHEKPENDPFMTFLDEEEEMPFEYESFEWEEE